MTFLSTLEVQHEAPPLAPHEAELLEELGSRSPLACADVFVLCLASVSHQGSPIPSHGFFFTDSCLKESPKSMSLLANFETKVNKT